MLSALIEGKDADLWFLVALILFVVAAVIRVSNRSVDAAIVAAGLAFVALGLLVL